MPAYPLSYVGLARAYPDRRPEELERPWGALAACVVLAG